MASFHPPFDKTYTEYCSFVDDEQTINLHYKFVPILGNHFRNYRAFSFKCSNESKCNMGYKCPIFLSHEIIKK